MNLGCVSNTENFSACVNRVKYSSGLSHRDLSTGKQGNRAKQAQAALAQRPGRPRSRPLPSLSSPTRRREAALQAAHALCRRQDLSCFVGQSSWLLDWRRVGAAHYSRLAHVQDDIRSWEGKVEPCTWLAGANRQQGRRWRHSTKAWQARNVAHLHPANPAPPAETGRRHCPCQLP